MALQVNKPIEVLGGMTSEGLYIRFYYSIDQYGQMLHSVPSVYTSKEAFFEDADHVIKGIPQIPEYWDFKYVREENGSDPLLYIHDVWKDKLSTDTYVEVPIVVDSSEGLEYDASTGNWYDPETGGIWYPGSNYLYDPSTGQVITEEQLQMPKLAEPDEIDYMDL